MARLSKDYPMKRDDGKIRIQPAGEVLAYLENGIVWRRERTLIDGVEFFRFTANPGMQNEVGSFWSTDAAKLKRLVSKRVGR
jgi:hypothetical protein